MKILLTAINAKYIHSNLAVYSLQTYARKRLPAGIPVQIVIREYTINQTLDEILGSIYEEEPDVLCFSCYIWNQQVVETLIGDLCRIRPDLPVWLGGPEVSYDSRKVLERLPLVKGVMKGEGEETFARLCQLWGEKRGRERKLEELAGITFRKEDGTIQENDWRAPIDLNEIPFVYQDLRDFAHRIIYYESSRGCPFSCSYCLSSIDKRLRFRDLNLVERELQFFLDGKAAQVKFVDRTFNCSRSHALAVWKYIKDHDNGVTNFHFEVSADLFCEEELDLLRSMRPGLIQLEIGVQTTNPGTLKEICRSMDFEKLSWAVGRIKEMKNIHQHLDLIAGLPYEDLTSFARSFDEVYRLGPHQLQLGFLKVLKGSGMQEKEKEYGLIYKRCQPYEVLRNRWLSYRDVLWMKGIEEMVEVYFNSRQFTRTLEELERFYSSPWRLYGDLWNYYRKKCLQEQRHRRSARYEIFLDWISETLPEQKERFRELLVYDYYLRENAKSRPDFAGEETVTAREAKRFFAKEERERRYLPEYGRYDRNQMRKMTHLEYFRHLDRVVLFDYQEKSPVDQEARTCILRTEDVKEKEEQ